MSTVVPLCPGGAPVTCDLLSNLPTSEDFRSGEMLTEPPVGVELRHHAGPSLQKKHVMGLMIIVMLAKGARGIAS
jgi:hypothetical protein